MESKPQNNEFADGLRKHIHIIGNKKSENKRSIIEENIYENAENIFAEATYVIMEDERPAGRYNMPHLISENGTKEDDCSGILNKKHKEDEKKDKDKSTDITCSAQNDSPGVVGQFGQAHLATVCKTLCCLKVVAVCIFCGIYFPVIYNNQPNTTSQSTKKMHLSSYMTTEESTETFPATIFLAQLLRKTKSNGFPARYVLTTISGDETSSTQIKFTKSKRLSTYNKRSAAISTMSYLNKQQHMLIRKPSIVTTNSRNPHHRKIIKNSKCHLSTHKGYYHFNRANLSSYISYGIKQTQLKVELDIVGLHLRYINNHLWVIGYKEIHVLNTKGEKKQRLKHEFQPHYAVEQIHNGEIIALVAHDQFGIHKYTPRNNRYRRLKIISSEYMYDALSVHGCKFSVILCKNRTIVTYNFSVSSRKCIAEKTITLKGKMNIEFCNFQMYKDYIFVRIMGITRKLAQFSQDGRLLKQMEMPNPEVCGIDHNGLLLTAGYDDSTHAGKFKIWNSTNLKLQKEFDLKGFTIKDIVIDVKGFLWV